MDYYLLTDLAAQVGHGLAISGAETFRVEDTIRRILRAYGIECEVFAIPNCLTISFEAANGKPLTIMKRIGFHGNDLDAVEQFNALSRRICRETPEVEVAVQWLEETQAAGGTPCRYTIWATIWGPLAIALSLAAPCGTACGRDCWG